MIGNLNDGVMADTSEAHKIFTQRWAELFHMRTIDSYSPKVFNLRAIISELCYVLEEVDQGRIHEKHISAEWSEAAWKAKDDITVEKFNPSLKKSLIDVLKVNPPNRTGVWRALNELRPLNRFLEMEYRNWVIEYLDDVLRGNDIEAAYSLCGILASELLDIRHQKSLYNLHYVLKSGEAGHGWSKFKEVITRDTVSAEVYIPLSADTKAVLDKYSSYLEFTILPAKVLSDAVDYAQKHGNGRSALKKEHIPSAPWFAKIVVSAHDMDFAKQEAQRIFGEKTEVLELFLDRDLQWTYSSAVVRMGNENKTRFKVVSESQVASDSDREAQLRQMIELLASGRLSDEDCLRLHTAAHYLLLSHRDVLPGTKLTNAWIALECLVRQGESVTEDIVRYVPPALSDQYVFTLLGNYLDDCRRCGVDLTLVLGEGTRSNLIIKLCRSLSDKGSRQALLATTSTNTLLTFRTQELIKRYSSGREMRKMIGSHNQHLTWHLQRLYRKRNEIIHSGRTKPFTNLCANHLSDYANRVLIAVVHKLTTEEKVTSVFESLTLLKHEHERVMDSLPDNLIDPSCIFDSPFYPT